MTPLPLFKTFKLNIRIRVWSNRSKMNLVSIIKTYHFRSNITVLTRSNSFLLDRGQFYVQKGSFWSNRSFLDRYKAISGHTIGSFRAEKRIFWVCCNGIKFNFLLALSKPHVTACEPLVSSKSPYRTANSWLFLILCLFKSLYDMVQPSTLQASIKVPLVLKIHMIQSRKYVDSAKMISFYQNWRFKINRSYTILYKKSKVHQKRSSGFFHGKI